MPYDESGMNRTDNVFLIGPMGAGKTTIGRVLADHLGKQFFDSDQEIEDSTGADIPWIFDVEGEAGFRQREERMINQLTRRSNIVLATGGGAILVDKNRQRLAARGAVVYLRASLQQQLERTSRDKNRPLLQQNDPETVIRELMAVREPLYREIADIVIDTNRRNPKAVCQDISRQLEKLQNADRMTAPAVDQDSNEEGQEKTRELPRDSES